MMKKGVKTDKGFTIVELMIATVVFSLILLLCAYALMYVGRTFYKGVTTNKTQHAARDITDQLIQAVQFSGSTISSNSVNFSVAGNGTVAFNAICIGLERRYTYVTGFTLHDTPDTSLGSRQIKHVMWVDENPTSCTPLDLTASNPGGTNGRELLGSQMRLDLFNVIAQGNSSWNIDIRVLTGDNDILTGSDGSKSCVASQRGGQFCATSELHTTATRRLL